MSIFEEINQAIEEQKTWRYTPPGFSYFIVLGKETYKKLHQEMVNKAFPGQKDIDIEIKFIAGFPAFKNLKEEEGIKVYVWERGRIEEIE